MFNSTPAQREADLFWLGLEPDDSHEVGEELAGDVGRLRALRNYQLAHGIQEMAHMRLLEANGRYGLANLIKNNR